MTLLDYDYNAFFWQLSQCVRALICNSIPDQRILNRQKITVKDMFKCIIAITIILHIQYTSLSMSVYRETHRRRFFTVNYHPCHNKKIILFLCLYVQYTLFTFCQWPHPVLVRAQFQPHPAVVGAQLKPHTAVL
jgi:hypothetical protein